MIANNNAIPQKHSWKQAVSNATFGESKLKLNGSPQFNEEQMMSDQNLDVLLSQAKNSREAQSRNADNIQACDQDTLVSNQDTITPPEALKQVEAKKKQD